MYGIVVCQLLDARSATRPRNRLTHRIDHDIDFFSADKTFVLMSIVWHNLVNDRVCAWVLQLTDSVTPEKRSDIMSRVGSKDTKPELLIRKGLHSLGFRYRLHAHDLPGKPDLVLPRYKSVIQVNGCFWHGHKCQLCRFPNSNKEYWQGKIARNIERDISNRQSLLDLGWRVLTIWECALNGSAKLELNQVFDLAAAWLRSTIAHCEIKGRAK